MASNYRRGEAVELERSESTEIEYNEGQSRRHAKKCLREKITRCVFPPSATTRGRTPNLEKLAFVEHKTAPECKEYALQIETTIYQDETKLSKKHNQGMQCDLPFLDRPRRSCSYQGNNTEYTMENCFSQQKVAYESPRCTCYEPTICGPRMRTIAMKHRSNNGRRPGELARQDRGRELVDVRSSRHERGRRPRNENLMDKYMLFVQKYTNKAEQGTQTPPCLSKATQTDISQAEKEGDWKHVRRTDADELEKRSMKQRQHVTDQDYADYPNRTQSVRPQRFIPEEVEGNLSSAYPSNAAEQKLANYGHDTSLEGSYAIRAQHGNALKQNNTHKEQQREALHNRYAATGRQFNEAGYPDRIKEMTCVCRKNIEMPKQFSDYAKEFSYRYSDKYKDSKAVDRQRKKEFALRYSAKADCNTRGLKMRECQEYRTHAVNLVRSPERLIGSDNGNSSGDMDKAFIEHNCSDFEESRQQDAMVEDDSDATEMGAAGVKITSYLSFQKEDATECIVCQFQPDAICPEPPVDIGSRENHDRDPNTATIQNNESPAVILNTDLRGLERRECEYLKWRAARDADYGHDTWVQKKNALKPEQKNAPEQNGAPQEQLLEEFNNCYDATEDAGTKDRQFNEAETSDRTKKLSRYFNNTEKSKDCVDISKQYVYRYPVGCKDSKALDRQRKKELSQRYSKKAAQKPKNCCICPGMIRGPRCLYGSAYGSDDSCTISVDPKVSDFEEKTQKLQQASVDDDTGATETGAAGVKITSYLSFQKEGATECIVCQFQPDAICPEPPVDIGSRDNHGRDPNTATIQNNESPAVILNTDLSGLERRECEYLKWRAARDADYGHDTWVQEKNALKPEHKNAPEQNGAPQEQLLEEFNNCYDATEDAGTKARQFNEAETSDRTKELSRYFNNTEKSKDCVDISKQYVYRYPVGYKELKALDRQRKKDFALRYAEKAARKPQNVCTCPGNMTRGSRNLYGSAYEHSCNTFVDHKCNGFEEIGQEVQQVTMDNDGGGPETGTETAKTASIGSFEGVVSAECVERQLQPVAIWAARTAEIPSRDSESEPSNSPPQNYCIPYSTLNTGTRYTESKEHREFTQRQAATNCVAALEHPDERQDFRGTYKQRQLAVVDNDTAGREIDSDAMQNEKQERGKIVWPTEIPEKNPNVTRQFLAPVVPSERPAEVPENTTDTSPIACSSAQHQNYLQLWRSLQPQRVTTEREDNLNSDHVSIGAAQNMMECAARDTDSGYDKSLEKQYAIKPECGHFLTQNSYEILDNIVEQLAFLRRKRETKGLVAGNQNASNAESVMIAGTKRQQRNTPQKQQQEALPNRSAATESTDRQLNDTENPDCTKELSCFYEDKERAKEVADYKKEFAYRYSDEYKNVQVFDRQRKKEFALRYAERGNHKKEDRYTHSADMAREPETSIESPRGSDSSWHTARPFPDDASHRREMASGRLKLKMRRMPAFDACPCMFKTYLKMIASSAEVPMLQHHN